MAKSKRRRTRQKQALEAESSITDSGGTSMQFVQQTKPSPTKQIRKKMENAICHEKSCPSQHAGNTRYDAVICHSAKDGKIALEIKTWLEENIPQQIGNSTRPSKIELIGTINANYATSFELASKRTKTMIVLCTKHFCHDAVFKKAVHALWTWEADRDLQVFPLLVGFEEQEPPPECISVRDAHILHFEDCKYFRYVMAQRLSHSSVQHFQSADETKGKRCTEKEAQDKHQQERKDNRSHRFSGNVHRENRGLRAYRETGSDEGAVHDSDADGYDSGVATTTDWSCMPSSSLFGPPGFSHDPTLMAVEERVEENDTTAPDTSSADLPEAAIDEISVRDPSQENQPSHRDAGVTVIKIACSQRKTAKNLHSSGSSTSATEKAKLTDDTRLQTDGPQSWDGAQISHTVPTDQSGLIHETTNNVSASMSLKPNTTWKPLRSCSLPEYVREVPEKEGYLTPVASSLDCEPYGSYSEAGGSSCYGEPNTFEYRFPLPRSQDQNSYDTQNSRESVNVDPQASRYETATIRLNQVSLEIEAGRQNMLLDAAAAAATVSPPDHGYTNTDHNSPSNLKEITTQRPSAFQPQPSTITDTSLMSKGDSAVADTNNEDVYEMADPAPTSRVKTRFQAHTVNIFKAHSVHLYRGADPKISNEDLRSPTAKCDDGMSTYQTWPCKGFETRQQVAAAGLSEDAAYFERKYSNRPQLPPPPPPRDDEEIYCLSAGDVYRPCDGASVCSSSSSRRRKMAKTRTSFASMLSGLRVLLLPCYRKKKKRRQKHKNKEQKIDEVPPDIDDPYDSISELSLYAAATVSCN